MNEKFNTEDAAEYLGLKPSTLCVWRCLKTSPQPAYVKMGTKVWYLKKDLDAFIESQTVRV